MMEAAKWSDPAAEQAFDEYVAAAFGVEGETLQTAPIIEEKQEEKQVRDKIEWSDPAAEQAFDEYVAAAFGVEGEEEEEGEKESWQQRTWQALKEGVENNKLEIGAAAAGLTAGLLLEPEYAWTLAGSLTATGLVFRVVRSSGEAFRYTASLKFVPEGLRKVLLQGGDYLSHHEKQLDRVSRFCWAVAAGTATAEIGQAAYSAAQRLVKDLQKVPESGTATVGGAVGPSEEGNEPAQPVAGGRGSHPAYVSGGGREQQHMQQGQEPGQSGLPPEIVSQPQAGIDSLIASFNPTGTEPTVGSLLAEKATGGSTDLTLSHGIYEIVARVVPQSQHKGEITQAMIHMFDQETLARLPKNLVSEAARILNSQWDKIDGVLRDSNLNPQNLPWTEGGMGVIKKHLDPLIVKLAQVANIWSGSRTDTAKAQEVFSWLIKRLAESAPAP